MIKFSDMSSDCCHSDGPHTDVLVSLHELLQAGNGRELQLRLSRLPALHRALFLARLGADLLYGQRQAVAVAQAGRGGEDGSRGWEVACGGLLRMGG